MRQAVKCFTWWRWDLLLKKSLSAQIWFLEVFQEDFPSIVVQTSKAHWCAPTDEDICPTQQYLLLPVLPVFTGTPKRRILKECRVATPVHLFCSKVLSWLRLCLVYHTDICSYSALCSTLDFLIMGMEGIGMITVKIYQNWALLSRLLTTPLMFTLNFCSLELCSFCAAITFNTLCKSLIVVQKSLKVCPAPALAGSSSPDVKCLYYLHWILDGFVFLFL